MVKKAAAAGYGQLALLPRSSSWRDRPELLQGMNKNNQKVLIHLWGGFSLQGEGKNLSRHRELLQNGAIGLAEDDSIPPIALLKQSFLLGDMASSPVLLAPRDKTLQGEGMVRESVETLRGGWIPDPLETEVFPLSQLLELRKQYPNIEMRLMNISTSAGVDILTNSMNGPLASVCWWYLLEDNSSLSPYDIGWSVTPSLGSPHDRESLKEGLRNGTLTAIAVHSIPLDDAEIKQPPIQRKKGLSAYQLVLPLLWQELIVKSDWRIEKLWDVLSFGPSKMLKLPEEKLIVGSNRWIIFDPNERWVQTAQQNIQPFIANQPYEGEEIRGKVIDSGLIK